MKKKITPMETEERKKIDFTKYGIEVDFIKGRLKFGNGENSAPFPSMVVVFKPCQ